LNIVTILFNPPLFLKHNGIPVKKLLNPFARILPPVLMAGSAVYGSVNKSIHIEDGKNVQEDLSTINGNITMGKNCEILW